MNKGAYNQNKVGNIFYRFTRPLYTDFNVNSRISPPTDLSYLPSMSFGSKSLFKMDRTCQDSSETSQFTC